MLKNREEITTKDFLTIIVKEKTAGIHMMIIAIRHSLINISLLGEKNKRASFAAHS